MPTDDWDGYENFADKYLDPNTEVQRMFRAYPVYPMTGIPREWIDRSDPNYQESIFQGQLGGVDPLGAVQGIGGPRTTKWWSALKRALQNKNLLQAKKMKGVTLLNRLKQLGVSGEELRWTQIQDLTERAGMEPVEMEKVRELAKTNKIQLFDVNLGDRVRPETFSKLLRETREKRDAAAAVMSRLPSGDYYEAEQLAPDDFAEYMKQKPLRLDKYEVEIAKDRGMSRIDYGRELQRRVIKAQADYHKYTDMVNKLDHAWWRLGKKVNPRHQSYVEDKPLPPVEGEDFRNWLVRLKQKPGVDPYPQSQHYKFENVLVGVIGDVGRTTMEGLPALHIEEYQSDWSKSIRRYGAEQRRPQHIEEEYQRLYQERELNDEAYWNQRERIAYLKNEYDALRDSRGIGDEVTQEARRKWDQAQKKRSELFQEGVALSERIDQIRADYPVRAGKPDMPFKDSEALKLGLKKALWEAARTGKSAVTWTRGQDLHKLRVGDDPEQKWPYFIYDQFTPKTIKSILKELGIKVEVKKMRYPGNVVTEPTVKGEYWNLRDRRDALQQRMEDIELDAEIDDMDPATHPDWQQLTNELRDVMRRLEDAHIKDERDVGFEVWGIELSPKDREVILKKGFKMSKLNQIAKEMMA